MDVFSFVKYSHSKTLEDLLNTDLLNTDFKLIEINTDDEESILSYLKSICDNTNLIDKVKNIDNTHNKLSFIKLIILYYNGGLVINDKIVIKNINVINELYKNLELIAVKSCVNNNLFNGFILCKKNNQLILNTINEFMDKDVNISIDSILFRHITEYEIIKDTNNILLNEKIIHDISYIYSEETIIAEHHFTKSSLELLINSKNIPKDLSNLKIGITFDVPEDLKSFYSNGIRQNALYLFELLKNIKYDVKLIIELKNEEKFKKIQSEIDFYKYDYSLINNIYKEEYNLIFSFGFALPKDLIRNLKFKGVKIISYQCGNAYLIDSETILYNQHSGRILDNYIDKNNMDETYNQIWSIPQMYKQNKGFWETLYRTKCIQAPFIWSSSSINFVKKILKIDSDEPILYKKKLNKIAIFEPNISLMKWCLPCLLITEQTYRKYKNIGHIYVTNIDKTKKMEEMTINKFNINEFTNLCRKLDIFKDNIMSVEGRFVTLDFMKSYADIVVSHQWENPLNYLYFDLAWMGWPILHNAYLCKDIGYYYSDFNYDEAAEKLNEIINNHDANKLEYMKENRKIIENYLPTNVELQNKYKNMIENLFV
jgi:hypothetical protein